MLNIIVVVRFHPDSYKKGETYEKNNINIHDNCNINDSCMFCNNN